MPGKRVPFDEETWQRRSQFAGLFLAEVSGISFVSGNIPDQRSGRVVAWMRSSARTVLIVIPAPTSRRASCCLFWSVKTLSAVERRSDVQRLWESHSL